MATISSSDNLFATATIMGRQIFNFCGSGIDSLSELIGRIRAASTSSRGLVTLTVRNSTQGWSQSRAFYI